MILAFNAWMRCPTRPRASTSLTAGSSASCRFRTARLHQYLTFSFSALIAPGSDPAFYDTLVELFDAVMRTFRWSYA